MDKKTTLNEINLDRQLQVVQNDSIIFGRQNLEPTEAKLIRICMSQIMDSDTEFYPYKVKIPELAATLGISASNLYRDIESICNNIINSPIEIRNGKSWVKYPWVQRCSYNNDTSEVEISLNSELSPFLLNLKRIGLYNTRYTIGRIVRMRSSYSIRIFEMIESKTKGMSINPIEGVTIELTIEELRQCTYTNDKYPKISDFTKSVIKRSVNEINNVTEYLITYNPIKKGRATVAYQFTIRDRYV